MHTELTVNRVTTCAKFPLSKTPFFLLSKQFSCIEEINDFRERKSIQICCYPEIFIDAVPCCEQSRIPKTFAGSLPGRGRKHSGLFPFCYLEQLTVHLHLIKPLLPAHFLRGRGHDMFSFKETHLHPLTLPPQRAECPTSFA